MEILKKFLTFSLMFGAMSLLPACSGEGEPDGPTPEPEPETSYLKLRSQSIEEGEEVRASAVSSLTLQYDYVVTVSQSANITLNGTAVTATSYNNDATISFTLEPGTSYTLTAAEGSFYSTSKPEIISPAFTLHFSTAEQVAVNIDPLVNSNATQATKNVYNFLVEQYGKKTLSGVMANVNNNNEFAQLVYRTTGSYPAINCYDFIHLVYSPQTNWINYSDIKHAKEYWENNGLVSYMWHWNMPTNESDDIATYSAYSDFDINAALTEGTWQNRMLMADIEEVAGYLKLLQDAGIPVIWRPLHEAAGNYNRYGSLESGAWFWWGKKGLEPTKQLWRLLYDQLVNVHGLNNLIWVWTVQAPISSEEDILDLALQAYPGDDVVDIVGCDIYAANVDAKKLEFDFLNEVVDGRKMVTLSECGNIPTPTSCFSAGDTWSWFTVWYYQENGNLVLTPNDGNFSLNTAAHWQAVMDDPNVINRDDMPSLK